MSRGNPWQGESFETRINDIEDVLLCIPTCWREALNRDGLLLCQWDRGSVPFYTNALVTSEMALNFSCDAYSYLDRTEEPAPAGRLI